MHTIDALLNRHQGEQAWIFGKGPSLDAFEFETAGPLRICINESLLVVPAPAYFFAHDEGPIENVAAAWPAGCCAILEHGRAEYAAKCAIEQRGIYVYWKAYGDNNVRDMPPEQIASSGSLYGCTGTVHSAIHFCRLIGASSVRMVGFDGGGGYARCLGMLDEGAEHDQIRSDSIDLMVALGLPYEFFQPVGSK